MAITCRYVDKTGQVLFDLNDESGYFIIDGTEFPLPEVLYTEVENSLLDGDRLAYWRIGGRKIKLQMYVQGTDGDDLQEKRDELFKRLLTPGTLEVCNWGETRSVFYTTRPVIPKMPDDSKWFVKEAFAETEISMEMPVEREVYTGKETIVGFVNLAPNGDIENWTDAALDDWTFTVASGSTITKETTTIWHGPTSVKLSRVTGDCYMTTTNYIPVDMLDAHQFDCFAKLTSGVPNLALSFLAYDANSTLISTVAVVSHAATAGWLQHACVYGASKGVIDSAIAFPANTTKVKLKIENTSNNTAVCVDQVTFGNTSYLKNHRIGAAFTCTVPPEDIKGTLPADMSVYLDKEFWQPSVIFMGERANYHNDHDGVRKPTDGSSSVNSNVSLDQSYQVYEITNNLLENPSLEDPGGFPKDNTDAPDHWAISRTNVGTGDHIGATDDPALVNSGGWAAVTEQTGESYNNPTGMWDSDKVNLDPTKNHYWSIRGIKKAGTQGAIGVYAYFYTDAVLLSGAQLTIVSPATTKTLYSGIVTSDQIPPAANKVMVRVYANLSWTGSPQAVAFDDVQWTVAAGAVIGEVDYNIESHEGKYIDLAVLSISGSTGSNNVITLQEQIVSDSLGVITELMGLSTCDIGDPDTSWVCTMLQSSTWSKSITPVTALNSRADLSLLSERVRVLLAAEFDDTKDFWVDFFARIPVDRAVMILTNLGNEEHLILGDEGAFVSLDGTVDSATSIDSSKATPPSAPFKADPSGINLVMVALYDNEGSYEPRPVMGIWFEYYPCWLL